jgi:ABC-2 type transport system permease protein
MTMQGTFWSLVKHDMKLRKRRTGQYSTWWCLFYGAAVVVAAIAVTTYIIRTRGYLDLNHVWFFTFWFPFMAFGMATGLTVHEWRNGTSGRWLALPMSRMRLVTSKFVAALLRTILSFAGIYCLIALLSVYAMLLQGTFTWQAADRFLATGLQWNALLLCACPFVTGFGVLYAVIKESRMRPVLPLVWMVFVGLWWLIFSRDNRFLQIVPKHGAVASLSLSPEVVYAIGISWILAYLLIRLASHVLDRQLTL